MGKKLDLVGQRFGRLVVLEEAGRGRRGHVMWLCKCDCGNETIVRGSTLRDGDTRSCGCLNREVSSERSTKHGMYGTRLYSIWRDVRTRAGNYKGASEEQKRDYIDRGITLCEAWESFENFRDWAISHEYSEELQIDRINNESGYYPENCRWVSPRVNVNNRRNTIKLPDGTPLALFCTEIGVETRENGKVSKQYHRILEVYRKHHKIHPELLKQLRQDLRDQARALYEIAMKRQYIQDKVEDLKKVLNSHDGICPR